VGVPVSAAAAAGVVTLTARHKGEVANHLDLRHSYYTGEALPKGLTLTIAAMSGGTANPDLGPALASLADRRCHYVVSPYADAANLTALEDWLIERWSPLKQLEGLGFSAAPGTAAELSTLGSGRNSEFICLVGTGKSPSAPEIWAAVWGAVAAYCLNIDPARPLQTLVLSGILPPATPEILDTAERNILLHDGISTHLVDDGGQVLIERAITTYQTNALGVDDPSYLDVNTMATLAYIKDQVRSRITNSYPRHKLADDNANVGAGQAIVRPKDLRAELISLFREMENNGIVEGLDQFKADLVVERNATDKNRVDALIPPDLVGQFRVFAGQVQFIL
jgi:phage tail sheath gpL-like